MVGEYRPAVYQTLQARNTKHLKVWDLSAGSHGSGVGVCVPEIVRINASCA